VQISTVPQQSAQPFISAETAIKPPVPIKDIVHPKPLEAKPVEQPPIEPQPATQPVVEQEADTLPQNDNAPDPEPDFTPDDLSQNDTVAMMEEESVSMENDSDLLSDGIAQDSDNEEDTYSSTQPASLEEDESLVVHEPKEEEDKLDVASLSPFGQSWVAMCNSILSGVPTLYHLFINNIPEYENHNITVTVNNGIAEAFFVDKKREILSWMRSNFNAEIEDVILDIQAEAVQKKFLLSNREQAELLHQQNSELSDFINLLGLKLVE
jgi:hypothetical protein